MMSVMFVIFCAFHWMPAALAQPSPPISPEELADQVARLELDEAGRARVEEIHARFVEEFREINEVTQSIFRWSNSMHNLHPGDMGEYSVVIREDYDRLSAREFRNRAQIEDLYFVWLREAFPGNVENVDWLERSHRRRLALARTDAQVPYRAAGTPDLIHLTEWALGGEDPYQNEALAAALNDFDFEMDAVLRARRQGDLEAWNQQTPALIAAGDRKGLVQVYEERFLPAARMRRLVEEHLPRIAAHLPPNKKAAFETKFEHMLFADLYLPARVDVLLERAVQREDLTESERGRLASIAAALERDRGPERARLRHMAAERNSEAGVRKFAAHMAEMQLTGQGSRMMPEDIEYHNELVPAFRAIGSEYEEEILRILGEEGE
jgi:hypothetical protein